MSSFTFMVIYGIVYVLVLFLLRPLRGIQSRSHAFSIIGLFGILPMLSLAARIGEVPTAVLPAICVASVLVLAGSLHRYTDTQALRVDLPSVCVATIVAGLIVANLFGSSSEAFFRDVAAPFAWLVTIPYLRAPSELQNGIKVAVKAFGAHCIASIGLLSAGQGYLRGGQSFEVPIAGGGRFTGVLSHPNAIGSVAAVVGMCSVAVLLGWMRVVVLAASLTVIGLSDQRGAMLAALFGLVVYWVGAAGTNRFHRPLRIVTAAIVCPIVFLWLDLASLIGESVSRRQASLDQREVVWSFAVSVLDQHLLVGLSPTEFREMTAGLAFTSGFAHAHNTILTYFVMGGLLAGIAMLVLTIGSVLRAVRVGSLSGFAVGGSVLVLGLTESPTFADANWLIVPGVSFVILASLYAWYAPRPLSSADIDRAVVAGKQA